MARLGRVMQFQLKAAIEADHPNLIPLAAENNVMVWHFLVVNLPGPFAGGEYIFRLTAPDNFPQKPPKFEFITKNGVFTPGGGICISVGEFHANDAPGESGSYGWRPSLGMIGFAREVVNGMLNPEFLGSGVRICNDDLSTKARYAAASVSWNQKNHSGLVAQFRAFETEHPDHRAVRILRMKRAALRAAQADFKTVMLESLPPLFAEAFGDNDWSTLSPSLGYLGEIPDLPFAELKPMGFPANGRTVLCRIDAPLRGALAETEESVRRVLCLALHARICLELAVGENSNNTWYFHLGWFPRFLEGFKVFLEHLPAVCGGASRVIVPEAMQELSSKPQALSAIHNDFTSFLRAQDIDEKARLGKAFATKVRASAAKFPAMAVRSEPPPGSSEQSKLPDLTGQASNDDLDSYIDELLGEEELVTM